MRSAAAHCAKEAALVLLDGLGDGVGHPLLNRLFHKRAQLDGDRWGAKWRPLATNPRSHSQLQSLAPSRLIRLPLGHLPSLDHCEHLRLTGGCLCDTCLCDASLYDASLGLNAFIGCGQGLFALAPPVKLDQQVYWLATLPFAYLLLNHQAIFTKKEPVRFSVLLVFSLTLDFLVRGLWLLLRFGRIAVRWRERTAD